MRRPLVLDSERREIARTLVELAVTGTYSSRALARAHAAARQ
ncbi:MAG: hypothetical protein AAGF11_41205 [Myxococcota bacterium]